MIFSLSLYVHFQVRNHFSYFPFVDWTVQFLLRVFSSVRDVYIFLMRPCALKNHQSRDVCNFMYNPVQFPGVSYISIVVALILLILSLSSSISSSELFSSSFSTSWWVPSRVGLLLLSSICFALI